MSNSAQRYSGHGDRGVKGVTFDKKNGKWKAYIYSNNKMIYLGLHENLEDAKRVREDAEKTYWAHITE